MSYLHVITTSTDDAMAYGRDLGYPTAAIRHVTTTTNLLGTQRAEVHVLPDARSLPNYASLIRAAEGRKATMVYAEEG